jgi:hypothetical protein
VIARPRSPTESVRSRKTEVKGEVHGGRPRPTGAVVPRKKKSSGDLGGQIIGLSPHTVAFTHQTSFSTHSDRSATRGRYVIINVAREILIASNAVCKLIHVCTFNHLQNISISANPSRL